MSNSNTDLNNLDNEYEPEKLIFSLKQGLCLDEVQKNGSVFDLDMNRDLEDLSYSKSDEYFDKECIFENLTYPEDSESESEDSQDDREPFEKIRSKMISITSDNGVMKRVKKPGYGSVPPEKSQVTIHYNGYLEFLDEPFDSTRLRNHPLKFILNEGDVLRGLDVAVASMRQTEIAEFLISPNYGLGEMGCPPRIPANATILYVVELLSIVDCAAAVEFEKMNPEDRKMASFAKVMEVCKADNRTANELFRLKQYPRCLKLYNRAVRMLSEVNMANEEEEKQQQCLLSKLFCNLSACHLNMNYPDRAIPCAIEALKISPDNSKALFRCGKASRLCGDFHTARRYLQKIARKEPNNSEVVQEIEQLSKDVEKYRKAEREFCSKIFQGECKPAISNLETKDLTVSEDFKMNIEKHLAAFKDTELDFMPFTVGFSDSEIEAIQLIATKMGFHCVVPEHGDAKLRIHKTKPEE